MCRPSITILSHFDPVHTTTSHFCKIHLNITLPSTPGSLFLRLPHQNPAYASLLLHTCYMTRPSNIYWFYHPKSIEWGLWFVKLLLCSFIPSLVTSSLLGPYILLNTLTSNILSLHSCFSVSYLSYVFLSDTKDELHTNVNVSVMTTPRPYPRLHKVAYAFACSFFNFKCSAMLMICTLIATSFQ